MKNHLTGTYGQVKSSCQVSKDVKMKFQEMLEAMKTC